MNQSITFEELNEKLHTLLTCNALEMILEKDHVSECIYIPYMMNDALENYFILEN